MTNVLAFFLMNEWDIKNDNLMEIWNKLTKEEKVVFNFDINSITLDEYLTNLLTGLKKYILKEDMSKVESHRTRYKR